MAPQDTYIDDEEECWYELLPSFVSLAPPSHAPRIPESRYGSIR